MATREEAIALMQRIEHSHPKTFFKSIDGTNAGIGCTMKFLSEQEHPVSAGEISDFMHVSTARVAVLLRKMAEKGLIERSDSPEDARRTMVSLSAQGRTLANEQQEKMISLFCTIIDRIGLERMNEFAAISEEIKCAVEQEMELHTELRPD